MFLTLLDLGWGEFNPVYGDIELAEAAFGKKIGYERACRFLVRNIE